MRARAVGVRIRERRRELGVKQGDLAGAVGISASYLNLIEGEKRRIGGALLSSIATRLDLPLDQLDGRAETRLRARLEELGEEPDVETAGAGDPDAFIAREPAWSRVAADLYRLWRAARDDAEALSDRLGHDPALAGSVHAMLTEIAALRSTAEILAEGGAIEPAQRARFEKIVYDQSSRLADTGAALAGYFEETAEARRRLEPHADAEEALAAVEDLGRRIEALAADAHEELDRRAAAARVGEDLVERLKLYAPPPDLPTEAGWLERRDGWALSLTRRFFDDAFGAFVREAFAGEEHALRPDVEALMRAELARRLADALILPAERMAKIGAACGWDVAPAARSADGDVALAMRRIASLGGRGGAPRAAHVSIDGSGRTLARRGALDLLPRSRALDCPVWPVHRAPPGAMLTRKTGTAEGATAIAAAWTRPDAMGAEMLVTPEAEATPDFAAPATVDRVGPTCRACGWAHCEWRREAQAARREQPAR